MTETVGLAATGPRGGQGGGSRTGTGQAIGRAISSRRSAGQAKEPQGFSGRCRGSLALRGSAPAPVAQGHHIPGSTETAQDAAEALPATATATATAATTAARLAKARLPVSSSVSSSTDPQWPSSASSPPSPSLLHRPPRTYLRTRASSSLAAAPTRPLSHAATTTTPVTARRSRRPSDDSAISLDDYHHSSSSPPPGSSPPSSVGHDRQPSSPSAAADSKTASSAYRRRRRRASSFDLAPAARPRPRAYSDQGPRSDDVSRPPQAFCLRRSSNPEPLVGPDSRLSPSSSHSSLRSRSSREPASCSAKGVSTSTGPPLSINTRLLDGAAHDARNAALHQHHQQHYQNHAQPRLIAASRQLLPLKTAAAHASSPPDETRRRSFQQHSYRLSLTGSLPSNASPIRVPPIRSFRSSGSRKSLQSADMNFTPRPYDLDESAGPSIYDQDPAHAATAGPYDRQSRLMTPPVSNRQAVNSEESGDVFLRLAREDAVNRSANGRTPDGTYSPVSATHRSWHRRPLSTNLTSSYQPLSPPKLSRRLSDQQERPFLGNLDDDQTSQTSRILQYRPFGREKAASAHPGESASQFTPSPRTHRPPPVSSRSPVYHDNSDNYRHTRRRSSVTESTPPISGRGQTYKTGAVHNYSKTYNSSPLVRSFDLPPPQTQEPQNVIEGTESTASTTAPSTMWDELDVLKSRINRLEVTGKLPSTSGAAVTKISDERPVTAGTTATTNSTSPKRQINLQTDETASVSTQREAYPILQNALANCKLNLSSQVYLALDCVAQDALGLSAAMGHGPIPSGASTIGTGSTATDRQLRRKAESVCRSLTELCITLNDEAAYRANTSQQQVQAFTPGTPLTPTLPKSHSSGLPVVRRSSVIEGNMALPHSSPRVMSRFEERRHSLLLASGPPVSLHAASHVSVPSDVALNRHSSLLVSRTRQPRQDDPDDGRESVLSRTRRAMTEEPEDHRKSTFLARSRRGTAEDMDQQLPLSRSPTRRTVTMAYQPANEHALDMDGTPDRHDTSSVVSSATSRRRLVSDMHHHTSRLAGPMGASPAPARKYLERAVSTREGAGTPTMERLARHASMHHRAGSQSSRSNRESMLPRPPNGNMTLNGSP
ncbi:cell wall anchor protein [Cordyceps militaris CM01]|uniref:Cell wall anchor protein n=1 Tax=Cordyceps militaris (strain CM01) TaxID=983644 RepID=G3J9M2_CORMM|nr:cell wall anchor protein [Cordyceps militaris CM01]EGX94148.1 cell wall anchor protein [Cordyceps militaris CM01]